MSMLPRWVAWSIAAVVVVCAAGLAVIIAVTGSGGGTGSSTSRPDAAVLTAYTTALRSPTSEGGRIVEQEMKPSIAEFSQGQVDAATFQARARGWELGFARVRDDIDKIAVPPAIASAGPLFRQAMDAYLDAAKLFEQAGGVAAGPQRDAAMQRAIAQAESADRQYDAAALVVQRALAAAGLPPDSALPNPTPQASPG